MRVVPTEFPGLLVVEPRVFRDDRGFFLETWSREAFRGAGLDVDFVQDNHGHSRTSGVLRGFHLQRPPKAQAKLVWVPRGAVLDLALDLRRGSPTYGRVFRQELNAQNQLRLFLPRGFAHAYLTLEPDTDFCYKVDAPYAPELEEGIRWDDPDLDCRWPVAEPVLSAKDRQHGLLRDFETPFVFGQE
ncbi:MAG: dTDP-4-dehydrorhamnose 3,5-epimerase [Desulfovibrio aminophilus]|uniref:dTDP-4-dehydrorhamnose 3,5-epimerase n=1 Tax=Desulfovibrio aminophilus TaxID=81425 RepID=UPI002A4396E7|nr:dTDP-4-dehydrorhamnose 3,5-epimerase [Desulfovibrionaceae bacterium]